MLLNRVDVNLQPRQGVKFGKAAALYRAPLGFPPVTFVLTTRCNISCAHCYSPRPATPIDLDPDLAKATADELRGMDRLYFSGGEPFQYFADQRDLEQRFMDLVHYVAARVERLYIDTNGSFLPSDLAGAISCLTQFPGNTTFVLSFDKYHAEALKHKRKSMTAIFNILFEACRRQGLRLELNSRFDTIDNSFDRIRERIASSFGVDLASLEKILIHANSVLAQGTAQRHPGARGVSLNDFIEHVVTVQPIGLFVTPRGLLVSGDHAAFLESPPAFATLGDLRTHTLAQLAWDKLLPGSNALPNALTDNAYAASLGDSFFPKDVKRIMARSKKPPSLIPPNEDEIAALVRDKSLPIALKIDHPETIRKVLLDFTIAEIDEAVRQPAGEVVDFFLQASEGDKLPNVDMFLQEGKLLLKIVPDRKRHLKGTRDQRGDFNIFLGEYEKLCVLPEGKHMYFSFLNAMYARLREHFHQLNDLSNFHTLQILLEEIEERLDGRHATEIIAFLHDNALNVEWTIKAYTNNRAQLVIGELNKRILESFSEGLRKEADQKVVRGLLQDDDVKRRLYTRMTATFVVRKGELLFTGLFL